MGKRSIGGQTKDATDGAIAAPLATAMRRQLRAFYRAHKRDLPWRHSRDPYAIWVSEIMLQQTQVDTVVPRYRRFLEEFPGVAQLAAAPEHRVCEAWAGLGYYRRARLMHQAACLLVAQGTPRLPGSLTALLALPGIGRYTAGAIASMAFDLPAPLVDGNVERVLSRHFAMPLAPRGAAGKRLLWQWASALQSRVAPGEINQALMELGALICRPRAPRCAACPWQRTCRAAAQGNPEAYPLANRPTPRQPLFVAYAWAADKGALWLSRRPLEGLWPGLWELPAAHGGSAAAAKALLQKAMGRLGSAVGRLQHTLSHRDVTAILYVASPQRLQEGDACRPFVEPLQAPLHTLARKAIALGLQQPRLLGAA